MQPVVRMMSAQGTVLTETTHRVLRNTYLLLAISMIPTVMGAMVGRSLQFTWLAAHPILGSLGVLAVMMGLIFGVQANRNNGLGVVLMLVLTGVFGVMLGPILQVAAGLSNGTQLVTIAAAGTGVIFFTLAGIATVSKRDFSFMGKFLMIGLIVVFIAMLANIFLQVPALSLTISAVAVLLFSGFILYDVSRVVNGGETNYIVAALAIYLDIYNLFVNLLHLLMAFAGERD